jgi:hypothetical protein
MRGRGKAHVGGRAWGRCLHARVRVGWGGRGSRRSAAQHSGCRRLLQRQHPRFEREPCSVGADEDAGFSLGSMLQGGIGVSVEISAQHAVRWEGVGSRVVGGVLSGAQRQPVGTRRAACKGLERWMGAFNAREEHSGSEHPSRLYAWCETWVCAWRASLRRISTRISSSVLHHKRVRSTREET